MVQDVNLNIMAFNGLSLRSSQAKLAHNRTGTQNEIYHDLSSLR